MSTFHLAALSAVLLVSTAFADEPVEAVRDGKQIIIRSGSREILRYQAEPGDLPKPDIKEVYRRGGYIQSVFSPAGRLVSDDFPPNHLHHHGIWSSWTKTEFEGRHPDFWNMGDGTGTVEFVSVDKVFNEGLTAGFVATHRFIDLTAKPSKPVMLETWSIRVRTDGKCNFVYYSSTQKCVGDAALTLPEYHYGGIGFRGNREWDGVEGCRFLTNTGLSDRNKVNASRAEWCWIGGKVDGEVCGITFVDSTKNFRSPQPVRAHPSEPFFCFAPQQLGSMEIAPGKEYASRYLIMVTDGEPDKEFIGRQAGDYRFIESKGP